MGRCFDLRAGLDLELSGPQRLAGGRAECTRRVSSEQRPVRMVISAFSIAYALASPATGWFLDWLGVEAGIAWAVAVWSLSSVLGGLSRSFGQLLGARTLLGASESAGVPAAGKLNATYLEPKNRAIGAAMTQVGLSIAGVAAPWLVAALPGWRQPLFVCACAGSVVDSGVPPGAVSRRAV